ncbi:hypothetical protein K438DRAFT_1789264 [Mycena galopus ATCC 62051]|nr:hypothetical protein K438DRAFT_1789264 [Mycena galopus ATCC 62051]
MVFESQTEKPAHPPRKQLKLGPLKGWGVQRDGVAMSAADYAQKDWDEFKGVSELVPYHLLVVIKRRQNPAPNANEHGSVLGKFYMAPRGATRETRAPPEHFRVLHGLLQHPDFSELCNTAYHQYPLVCKCRKHSGYVKRLAFNTPKTQPTERKTVRVTVAQCGNMETSEGI